MANGLRTWAGIALAGAVVASTGASERTAGAAAGGVIATPVRAPMTCSRGPGEHWFTAAVSVPRTVERASRYTVRIDGVPSGKIAAFGLNHIHDMATDYIVPPGATYVPGSARVVPDTGTPNVAVGARVGFVNGLIRMELPERVESGSSYTPPSIEFQLEATAPVGTALPLVLLEYRVVANAVIVGDVHATCEPVPKRYVLGTTTVTAPSPSP